jgi:hypothetical protein
MIIVKTSNGDVLINDRELVKLTHDRHNHFVYAKMKGEGNIGLLSRQIKPIDKVEQVIYINEDTGTERKDEGSEIAYLSQQWASEKNMVGFLCQLSEQIEKKLRDFACDIIQIVQYGDTIPDDIRKRLRDHAEEAKAWALDKGKWWERQEYLDKHQKQVEAETAYTATLGEKIEQQAERILSMERQLDDAKGEARKYQFEMNGLNEANEALTKRNLWQRIFNR